MKLCNQEKDIDEKQRKIQSLLNKISIMNGKKENLKSYIYKNLYELDLKMLEIISSEGDNSLQDQKKIYENILKKLFDFQTVVFTAKKENKETLQEKEK